MRVWLAPLVETCQVMPEGAAGAIYDNHCSPLSALTRYPPASQTKVSSPGANVLDVSLLIAHMIQLQAAQYIFLLPFALLFLLAASAVSARRTRVGSGLVHHALRCLVDDAHDVKDTLSARKLCVLGGAPRQRRERAVLLPRELTAARFTFGRGRVGISIRQVEAQPKAGSTLERQLRATATAASEETASTRHEMDSARHCEKV